MDRRTFLASTGIALSVPVVGCLGGATGDGPPDRPWTPADRIEDPGGVHDLFVENHTDATEAAWIRVVRDDGAALVDGRYELPDGRGIEFDAVAGRERTYAVDLAIDGEDVASLEWATEACGQGSEAPGGSRNAIVRVGMAADEHPVSLVVDECDALHGPELPTGPAESFRLDE